jgi:hypothetical protein
MASKRPQPLAGDLLIFPATSLLDDLDKKVVVGIATESDLDVSKSAKKKRCQDDETAPAHPGKPYPDTSFWKSTSLTGGLTSCECNLFSVEMCSRRIFIPLSTY